MTREEMRVGKRNTVRIQVRGPETEAGRRELMRRVAAMHADAIRQSGAGRDQRITLDRS